MIRETNQKRRTFHSVWGAKTILTSGAPKKGGESVRSAKSGLRRGEPITSKGVEEPIIKRIATKTGG